MSKICLNVQFSFFDMVTPFSKIVEEHNYFWELQDGKIGEAAEMDPIEEQTFSLNNFGDEVTAALHKSGDL
ncbi:hypothetical protein ABD98_18100 [Bacillus mycoides]|nr:hypothetical protein [Bacillus mycoides]MBJ8018414.1 hypothetical protein [Bacillus cereus group sp. N34]